MLYTSLDPKTYFTYSTTVLHPHKAALLFPNISHNHQFSQFSNCTFVTFLLHVDVERCYNDIHRCKKYESKRERDVSFGNQSIIDNTSEYVSSRLLINTGWINTLIELHEKKRQDQSSEERCFHLRYCLYMYNLLRLSQKLCAHWRLRRMGGTGWLSYKGGRGGGRPIVT